MSGDRHVRLGLNPFRRLADLLAPHQPKAGLEPIRLTAGDPTLGPPAFVPDILQREAALWADYPPTEGTPQFRQAAVDWLTRRYQLPAGMLDQARHVLPAPGSREGLFMLALAVVPEQKAGQRPVVLLPNPFYHVYRASSVISGAEPVFLDATRANGFLPDLDAIPESVLQRTALFFLCSPSNPQGAIASAEYLDRALSLARQYDFVLAVDECYAEIYTDTPPPGGLEAAARSGSLDHLVVLHSLSKRSSAPGLRSGFVAGCPAVIRRHLQVIEYGGAGVPGPIQAASVALWEDEAHVPPTRTFYRELIDEAERVLGNRFGFYRPPGGFFLWLEVGDGEAAALKLWTEAAVRVLPGGYLTAPAPDGSNHGDPFIRVAMIHPKPITAEALRRMAEVL
ncbi:MAG: aminotransferase class I/II-fold pyridoxal phosphate-dependent enzyme [Alphaproteobacteria bacterium]|nr:aminotransferase class I/II-fold pyridoxal phosphate-dependent enzyme [Alphaproteobacteria bacterium]